MKNVGVAVTVGGLHGRASGIGSEGIAANTGLAGIVTGVETGGLSEGGTE